MFFFFQAEDGIRDSVASRGLGDVYKRQEEGVSILAIRRRNGQTEALSSNVGLIEPGDSLILLGPDDLHDNFMVQ